MKRSRKAPGSALDDIYKRLLAFYGPQGWWPGDTRLEIIVGAILTQNTAWTNVAKAVSNLKKAGVLSHPSRIYDIPVKRLARLIRPSGYYNLKARRLKNFIRFLKKRYCMSLDRAAGQKTEILRGELLGINGIGPETCDSILLYAFKRPVFVIDAYTKRVLDRHGIADGKSDYYDLQRLFMENLPEDYRMYNEYHALIVKFCKEACRKKPCCAVCPLKGAKLPCKQGGGII